MGTENIKQETAQGVAELQTELLHKLRNGTITSEQLRWFNHLTFEQREALMTTGKQPEKTFHLKLVSGAETLIIDPQDTKEQEVLIYKIVKEGNFAQILDSLEVNLDKLWLKETQIKNFCTKYPKWFLRNDKHPTFFLSKLNLKENKFFTKEQLLSVVCFHMAEVYFEIFKPNDNRVWTAGYLVIPKLD